MALTVREFWMLFDLGLGVLYIHAFATGLAGLSLEAPASSERRHLGHGHHGLADGHQRHLDRLPLLPGGTSRERG